MKRLDRFVNPYFFTTPPFLAILTALHQVPFSGVRTIAKQIRIYKAQRGEHRTLSTTATNSSGANSRRLSQLPRTARRRRVKLHHSN